MGILGKRIDPSESISKLRPLTNASVESVKNGAANEALKTLESFEPRTPLYTFDKVILPSHVLEQFKVLKSRITNHKLLYEEWGLADIDPQGVHIAFNLYGPPGTGKTMCVEALAATLGKNIIDVSYAEIESKYVGETGKNIVAAFKTAKQTGAILFFDEADSILGKRMTNVTQAADHGVNVARAVMLKQLDAFDGIVAFATNLAKNFDGAFVRRILLHIEIPLPDESGRLQMWRKMIGCRIPGYEELDLQLLAKESSGLSGGDIKNAVVTSFALTASRLEYERRITTSDISSTVQQLRKARNEMGTKPLVVKEEVLNA